MNNRRLFAAILLIGFLILIASMQNCGVAPRSAVISKPLSSQNATTTTSITTTTQTTSTQTTTSRTTTSRTSTTRTTTTQTTTTTMSNDILKDTRFSAGYRAHYEFCSRYTQSSPHPGIHLGDCVEYANVPSGMQIRTIPDPLGQPNDIGKYWGFEEGEKQGLICGDPTYHTNLPPGPYPPEVVNGETMYRFAPRIYSHRMSSASTVVVNQQNLLSATNSSPLGRTRYISSNKNGSIVMGYDSANDWRNIAVTHSPCYKYETWTHMYVWQNLKEPHALNLSNRAVLTMTVKINRQTKVRTVPNSVNDSLFGFNLLIRSRSNPYVAMWLGTTLYGDPFFTGRYDDSVAADQWGIAILNMAAARFGGPLTIGTSRTFQIDLKAVMRELLPILKARYPESQHTLNPNDYMIYTYGMGWESVGEWDSEVEISNFSLKALN